MIEISIESVCLYDSKSFIIQPLIAGQMADLSNMLFCALDEYESNRIGIKLKILFAIEN